MTPLFRFLLEIQISFFIKLIWSFRGLLSGFQQTTSPWVQKKLNIFCSNQSCNLHSGELFIGGEAIERIDENCRETSFKFLGPHLDEHLSWSHHSNHVYKKLVSASFALSRSKVFLPTYILKSIYQSLFVSHLQFGSIVWGSAKSSMLSKLEIQQKKAIRHVVINRPGVAGAVL